MLKDNISFPLKYKAAVLKASNTPLEIQTKKIDLLKKGQVLVKILSSPVNPSDLSMLTGEYPHRKTYPFVPGLEACGLVVASGGGFMANFVLNKRVACSSSETGDGTWAEYMVVPAGNCIPLIKSITTEQAASTIVNPLTAMALIEMVKANVSTSFINTAAAGALGKMIIKLADKENLTVINIVRRKEQAEDLKNNGAQFTLNSSDENFKEQLKEAYKTHKANIILDAVGGNFIDTLLHDAPNESKLISYASLSRDMIQVHPVPIIRFGKKIEGFHLAFWFSKQSKIKLLRVTRKVQKLIVDGTLGSKISNRFSLDNINEAIYYYKENMSEGKSILKF